MNYVYYLMRGFRKIGEVSHLISPDRLSYDYEGQAASDLIKTALLSSDPCMICRYGYIELNTILNYEASQKDGNFLVKSKRYLLGETSPFWYDERITWPMREAAGFFPVTVQNLEKFSQLNLEESKNIDILASWIPGEKQIQSFFKQAKTIRLKDLEPYYHKNPWSEALENKKVLVIHPFEHTITRQYENRENLFDDPRVLPDFHLLTYKPVYILPGEKNNPYKTWFEAL